MSVSAAGMLVAAIAAWAIDHWIPLGDFVPAFRALVPGIMLINLSSVAIMLLERALEFRRIALVEMINQLTLTFVSVAVGFFVPSFWAPVCGFWAAFLLSFGVLAFYVRAVFRPVWNVRAMLRIAGSSVPFASTLWVTQLRTS